MELTLRSNAPRKRTRKLQGPVSLPLVIALVVALTLSALFYAYCSLTTLELGYRMSHQSLLLRRFKELNRQLTVELNTLLNPQRLEREGRRLGLGPAKVEQMRRLK